ncbi:MAG: hypothetical protein QXT45_06815 [Candidatus Bilamarchaeaceae archaeon]
MSITFTAAERKAITRRQIKIDLENDAFQSAANAFNEQEVALQQVDNANVVFYNFYNSVCTYYENEARRMNGAIPDTYTNADLIAAAETAGGAPFFPTGYNRAIPLIADGSFINNKVKGFFHPTGTDARFEQNILNNTTVFNGLQQMIFRLENGITASTPSTTTTTTAIPAGPVTGLVLSTTSTTGFSVGQLVYINGTSGSGIYTITAIVPSTSITVSSVIHTQTGITGTITLDNDVPAFTATERQNLTSTLYNELLNNIANRISALVDEWEGKIDDLISDLTSQPDDRTPFQAQRNAALAAVNAAKATITTWKALPNTGPTGKYVASSIAPLSSQISTRLTDIPTRISQITTALGSTSAQALTQSGDNFSTSIPNNPYFNRYKWLNNRINRIVGSLRRYYAASQSKSTLNVMMAANTSIQSEYDSYFKTVAITFNDGSDIIHVKSNTGFSVGDNVIIVSETEPEITRTIQAILGTTQIRLNAAVPVTYRINDMARLFKIL